MPRQLPAPPPRLLVLAVAAAVLLAALMTVVAVRGGDPFGVDTALHDWMVKRRSPARNDVFEVITHSGDDIPPMLLAAVAGVLATRGRRWWLAALVANLALLAGQLVRYGLVSALGRPRPPEAEMVLHSDGPAMPSGHASTSALVAIGLAVALLPYCQHAVTRALAVAVPAAWAVAVGVSRVYLGVHWPTDVLAGWLYATPATCLGLPLVAAVLRRLTAGDAAAPTRWL